MLKSAGKYSVMRKPRISGVVTRQASVVMPVIEMDKGILPLAKYVKIFEVVPPGIDAIRAMPIATPAVTPVA